MIITADRKRIFCKRTSEQANKRISEQLKSKTKISNLRFHFLTSKLKFEVYASYQQVKIKRKSNEPQTYLRGVRSLMYQGFAVF